MSPNPAPEKKSQTSSRIGLRSVATFLAIALLMGFVLMVLDLFGEHPDVYQPARSAIANAAQILSKADRDQEDMLEKLRQTHKELDHALKLLNKVEKLDPAVKKKIENMQTRLEGLEEGNRPASADPEALHKSYQEMVEELNRLARSPGPPGG